MVKMKEQDELIIIKTNANEAEKTKKFLDKEHINYEIYNPKTSHKTKISSRKRKIEEVVKAFDRASTKY